MVVPFAFEMAKHKRKNYYAVVRVKRFKHNGARTWFLKTDGYNNLPRVRKELGQSPG